MNSDQDTACAVGCPIRRSRDQRSLASPPGFSQRATSFIASQCQGIHQMPFLRASRATPNGKDHQVQQSSPFRRHFVTEPTGQRHPLSEKLRPRLPSRSHNSLLHICPSTKHPAGPAQGGEGNSVICRDFRCFRPAGPFGETSFRLSASVQLRCTGSGGERARTVDLLLAKQALSQLSYTPVARRQGSGIRDQNCRLARCGLTGPPGPSVLMPDS